MRITFITLDGLSCVQELDVPLKFGMPPTILRRCCTQPVIQMQVPNFAITPGYREYHLTSLHEPYIYQETSPLIDVSDQPSKPVQRQTKTLGNYIQGLVTAQLSSNDKRSHNPDHGA